MFDSDLYPLDYIPSSDASEAEKQHRWRSWVSREIQQRALLALYMLDGLISHMSGEPTSVRHATDQLLPPSSEAAFEAATADEWIVQMRSQTTNRTSFRRIFRSLFQGTTEAQNIEHTFSAFSFKVVLEGLQSLISDCEDGDGAAVGTPSKTEVRRALAQVYECIIRNVHLSSADRLETLLRWHAICLDSVVESSLLCRSLCARYNITQHIWGGGKGSKPGLDLARWATSDDARKALLHATAIQEIVEELPRGRAHVIHMPGSLFAAATVYSVFALAGLPAVKVPSTVIWQDVLLTNSGEHNFALGANSDTKRYIRGEQLSGTSGASRNLLYGLNSMQKLFRCLFSQWGVAYDMENVIDKWITLCH
jgi:hypothetical protein